MTPHFHSAFGPACNVTRPMRKNKFKGIGRNEGSKNQTGVHFK